MLITFEDMNFYLMDFLHYLDQEALTPMQAKKIAYNITYVFMENIPRP